MLCKRQILQPARRTHTSAVWKVSFIGKFTSFSLNRYSSPRFISTEEEQLQKWKKNMAKLAEGSKSSPLQDFIDRLTTCVASADAPTAMGILQEILEKDLKPTTHIFNLVLECLGRNNDQQNLEDCLMLMKLHNVKYNFATYMSLIRAYVQLKDIDRAVTIFEEMKATRTTPNDRTYQLILQGYSETNVKQMVKLFEEMKNSKLIPGINIYTIIIYGCMKSDMLELALNYYNEMRSAGIIPNHHLFASMFHVLGKNPKYFNLIQQYWQEMNDLGVPASARVYQELLHIALNNKNWQFAEELASHVKLSAVSSDSKLQSLIGKIEFEKTMK